MANVFKNFFGKFAKMRKSSKKNNSQEMEIKEGDRISSDGYNVGDTESEEYQASVLLTELRSKSNVGEQIEVIADKDPDVSQAVWSFQRLCMQGIKIEIFDLDGNRNTEAEDLFNLQCKNWNKLGQDGLDGLIDNLHKVGLLYNVMMIEVVVSSPQENTFSGIYIIDPRTIEWKMETVDGIDQWIPYQNQNGNSVNLTDGNVFWVIANPDISTPSGSFLLEPAIAAIDNKLQNMKDSALVLRRQGYPYNVYTIDKQKVINSLPAAMRNDPKKIKKAINDAVELAARVASNREPTQDIVLTDDITVDRSSNSSAGSSIDIRAWTESNDVQVLNGCKTLGILMNRNSGSTESWGTVQMKLVTDMVTSFQNKSKRLIEDVGNMWMQLNGYQGHFKLTHNPIEYQSERQKWQAQNEKDTHYATAQEKGWISIDEAAQGAVGNPKATGTTENSSNSNNSTSSNNSDNSDNSNDDNKDNNKDNNKENEAKENEQK